MGIYRLQPPRLPRRTSQGLAHRIQLHQIRSKAHRTLSRTRTCTDAQMSSSLSVRCTPNNLTNLNFTNFELFLYNSQLPILCNSRNLQLHFNFIISAINNQNYEYI